MDGLDAVRDVGDESYRLSRERLGDSVGLVDLLLDAYEVLGELIRTSGLGPDEEIVCGALLLLAARYQLPQSVLALFKGQRNDSYMYSRRAIEACAYAARIKRDPALAEVWLKGRRSNPDAFREYWRQFRPGDELFPEDHEVLGELFDRYRLCSAFHHATHSSLVGHASVEVVDGIFTVKFSDVSLRDEDRSEPATTFLWIVNTHTRILEVFSEVFERAVARDRRRWELRLNALDAAFVTHRDRWSEVLPRPNDGVRQSREGDEG